MWDENSPIASVNPSFSMVLEKTHANTIGLFDGHLSFTAEVMHFSGQHGAPSLNAIGHIGRDGHLFEGVDAFAATSDLRGIGRSGVGALWATSRRPPWIVPRVGADVSVSVTRLRSQEAHQQSVAWRRPLAIRRQKMRTLSALIAVLVVALASTGMASADEIFRAPLTGDQEVPPVATNMSGKVKIEFNKTETAAEFTLTVNEGVRVQQAHIHCAPVGVNGPIVVFLAGFHAPGWDVDGKWISNATFTDRNIVNTACGATLSELAQAMRDGNTYANVHTVAHPAGEIRGQIRGDGD